MTLCPNSAASGCRCPQHHLGLAAHAPDIAAYEAALEQLRPTVLRVVTMPTAGEVPCTGTMTCGCERCVRDRLARPALGAGPAEFKIRPARHLRRAA